MEGEGAPVTVATGALGPVVAKLGALLGGDYKLRRRTCKDVKFIKSKLKSVHSILWAVWEKEILDGESKDLKKEALDLADDMHDAIDDFILTMERSHRSKRLIQSKIDASPFQDFRARVDDVSGRCCSKWNWKKNKCAAEPISSLFSRKSAKSSTPSKPPPPRTPFVHKNASALVGMRIWREDLIKYLVGQEPQLKMASIVGMAGVGKTTLAHLVYEDEEIKNKFQSRAFVSVTPSPNMKEVLTSIHQQVRVGPLACTEARSEEHIIHAVSNFLQDKRYLVIIDDIWHRGEWDIISMSFPKNNLGSRIVMTTRIGSVPGDDFDNNKLYRMNPERHYRGRTWLFGPDKEDVAALMKPNMVGEDFDCEHPIVRMCCGVPLALLCMFSAMEIVREQQERLGEHLGTCDVQDIIEEKIKQSGIQNTPGFEPLVESLRLDYDDLPNHMLKTCLLYCSIYPENYYFGRTELAMRWAAEGFICKEGEPKAYFEEVCNRGLMLPKDSFGRAHQMSLMMQNFLRWKLREDNFITWSSDITSSYAYRVHRLCIDDYPDEDGAEEGVTKLDWSQIRSLVVFEGAKIDVPFKKLERMRVLDLQFKKELEKHHVEDICGLLRVRHLFGLEGRRGAISELPPEIAMLQYLETLQVSETSIRELPGEIGNLKKLKALDVSGNRCLAELPKEIGGLQHLETLDLSGTNITELPKEIIGRLKKLKNLDVSINDGITELPREIRDLQQLATLRMGGNEGITRLPSEIGYLRNLETLDLRGNKGLTELPREMGNLQNLKRLGLDGTELARLPREIGRLKKLEILELELTISTLPWEAGQLSKLEGVPECVRQASRNSDLVSCVLAGEIISIQMVCFAHDRGGLIVGTKHMQIPLWIKDHFNDLAFLDIRICKLEDKDLKILREMPSLGELTLRFEVVPRKPIAISGEGFPGLQKLIVDSRTPPVITFQEGAMPILRKLCFEFKLCSGTQIKDPLGIKHLGNLSRVEFKCEKWYKGAESSRWMSAMIDVVRKETLEHPNNEILFHVPSSTRKLGFQQWDWRGEQE